MNLKPWQIFVFSLIPLALAFAGVIGGSIHGSDSELEDFSQTSAPPPPTSGSPAPGGSPAAGGGTTLTLTAQSLKFDKSNLTAPANTSITVQLTNNDAGVLHNVAFYRTRQATQLLTPQSRGDLFAGPATRPLTFTTPGPGTYFFRCDAHPDMSGNFTVR